MPGLLRACFSQKILWQIKLNETAIPPGKPTVVVTVEDTAMPHRYELEVTAVKVK